MFLGLFGLYLRRKLEESPIYENEQRELQKHPTREPIGVFTLIRFYYKDIIVCFVAVAFFNVTNYMVTAYLPSYLEGVIKLNGTTTSIMITCIMVIMIPLALMFGRIADRIGEKKVFLIGLGGLILLSVVAFSLMQLQSLFFCINRCINTRFLFINLRSNDAWFTSNDVLYTCTLSCLSYYF